MKNLKKILMALVLVALLVSAAVTVAIAESSYTGSVKEAEKLLDAVLSDPEKRAENIAPVYEYLTTTPINPEDKGYDELIARYNDYTFKIAYLAFKSAESTSGDSKTTELKSLKDYLAKAPVIQGGSPVVNNVEEVVICLGYTCKTCDASVYFDEKELFTATDGDYECQGGCSNSTKEIELFECDYFDFERDVNDACLDVIDALVDQLLSAEGGGNSYFDIALTEEEMINFINSTLEMDYTQPEAPIYTGDVNVAIGKLESITSESTYEELKTALAEAYSYLLESPVNPTTDEYYAFFTKYTEASETLVDMLGENIANADNADKLNMLVDFCEYLAKTPISEKTVEGYNDLRLAVIETIASDNDALNSVPALDLTVPSFVYAQDFADFKAELDRAVSISASNKNDANIPLLVAELYNKYISVKAFDPATEGYADAMAKYSELCVTYVTTKYISKIDSLDLIADKYTVLVAFNDYIKKSPLCDAVVNLYNSTREELLAEAKDVLTKVSADNIPVYNAPEADKSTVTAVVLNSFLSDFEVSYNTYIASASDKAVAFEDLKNKAATIYTYISDAVFDRSAAFYGDFISSYSDIREKFTEVLFADAALADVKAFLSETPISFEAVDRYNSLAADGEKLTSVYYDLSDLIETVLADGTSMKEKLDATTELWKYESYVFDTTDPVYDEYQSALSEVVAVVSEFIYNDVSESISKLSGDALTEKINDYVEYIKIVYTKETVTALSSALQSVANTCEAFIIKIEGNDPYVAYYTTGYEDAYKLIETFDSAKNLQARFDAFAALYELLGSRFFTAYYISGESYPAFIAEYNRVFAALENELLALLDENLTYAKLYENFNTVKGYIETLTFSEKVVSAYNALRTDVLEDIAARDFAAEIEEKAEVLTYTNIDKDGWSSKFARILIALNMCTSSNEVGDEFFVAYKLLGGLAGVGSPEGQEGPKVLDFTDSDFLTAVDTFNAVKAKVVEDRLQDASNASTIDEKLRVLNELKEYTEANPFSNKFVDAYNELRLDIYADYQAIADGVKAKFPELVSKIKSTGELLAIDVNLLDEGGKIKQALADELLNLVNYVIVSNEIESLNIAGGEFALIHQNLALDSLKSSLSGASAPNFTDAEFVEAVTKYAFSSLLDMFDSSIASLSPVQKENKITALATELVGAQIPDYLASLFEERYLTTLSYFEYDEVETKDGTLSEFRVVLAEYNKAVGYNASKDKFFALCDFVKSRDFDTENKGTVVLEKLEVFEKTVAEATEAQKAAIEEKTDISEYELPVFYDIDYETNVKLDGLGNANGAAHSIVSDPATGNRYAQLKIGSTAGQYFEKAIPDYSKPFVIELDIMGTEGFNFSFYFYQYIKDASGNATTSKTSTNVITITDGVITATGNLAYTGYDSANDTQFKLVPGQWTRFTAILDITNGSMELLVDYVSLGTRDIISNGKVNANNSVSDLKAIRFSGFKPDMTFAYDNVKIYQGTNYRTFGKVENLTNDEKFNLYIESILDETADASTRLKSYYAAVAMKDTVTSACDEAKAKLNAFDPEPLQTEASAYHISRLEALAEGLSTDSMTSSNAAAVAAKAESVSAYIEENRVYIDQADERFTAINKLLADISEKSVWLQNLSEYLTALNKFHRAPTMAALNKHYEVVKTYYDLCDLDKADEAAMAAADPIAAAFVKSIESDEKILAYVSTVTLASYYDVYIPARMTEQLYYENSLKILDCVDFIESIVPNKDELTTEEFHAALLLKASENSDFVDPYLTVIRNIVNANAYDASVEGTSGALVIFELLDELFFEALQNRHFAVIKEKLDRYNQTDSYIEKAGICTFVENYIAENNVDMTGTLGVQYMYSLNIYKAELEEYKADYEAILASNTQSFIGIVQKMGAYITYGELKPLYDEAIAKYYYNMNVDSDAVKAALTKFAEYEAKITAWEENATLFLGFVDRIESARNQPQLFRALVNSKKYIDLVDTTVDGVAEGLKTYSTALAEYQETITPVNEEISFAQDIACALRTGSIAATVLATIKTIINQ